MDIGPIFFKEILFFDFLEESTYVLTYPVVNTTARDRLKKAKVGGR